MTIELTYLTWTAVFTGLMWMPYILNMILVRGVMDAVGYPDNPAPLASWAQKLKAAHYNAVENLVVFATLVLVAHAAGISNGITETACLIYFWARIAHAVAYTLAIPFVRTVAFLVGVGCYLAIALQLLA